MNKTEFKYTQLKDERDSYLRKSREYRSSHKEIDEMGIKDHYYMDAEVCERQMKEMKFGELG